MDFRFLHAADIHLDSPLNGLSAYDGVPVETVRTATRTALDNLVAYAIAEKVAFVVIAGDLYDGTWEAFSTGLYFCAAMGRLGQAGIDVFLVYGNHDAESHLTRQLPLPANLKVFRADHPETFIHEPTGATLHGQSYKTRDPGGDLSAGYPAVRPGSFNVGVLHTALNGDRGHAPYAPCHPDQLAAKGYDYWALGHVHSFEVVRADPHIIFPGNLQGRHVKETGPKGAALVTVSEGRVEAVEHIAFDAVRWALVEVNLTGVAEEREAHDRIRVALERALSSEAEGRPLMARVRLAGETSLHDQLTAERNALREAARAIANSLSDALWIEKVALATQPLAAPTPIGDDITSLLTELAADPTVAAAVASDLAAFLTRAPAELDHELPLLGEARQGRLEAVLEDAAAALRARLHDGTPA